MDQILHDTNNTRLAQPILILSSRAERLAYLRYICAQDFRSLYVISLLLLYQIQRGPIQKSKFRNNGPNMNTAERLGFFANSLLQGLCVVSLWGFLKQEPLKNYQGSLETHTKDSAA